VTLAPGNSRYRATPGDFKVKTGADGSFKVTFPEAGMYWLNATVRTGETGRGPRRPGRRHGRPRAALPAAAPRPPRPWPATA
jgi:hypothetical protein